MLRTLADRNLLVYQTDESGRQILNVPETVTRIEREGQLPVPPTIRDVILARLRPLSNG